jgi:BirA family biotin operon repressor/biotin-[acetyl-CoA-carboxylase] ligase
VAGSSIHGSYYHSEIIVNKDELNKILSKLPLGDIRYFESIGSTNDEALAWATAGAMDMSLVVADEQTLGRGRYDRPWITPPATALAVSIILRPSMEERSHLSRIVGLAALAVSDALQIRGLDPEIKWPNDILLNMRKVAGILIELVWSGDTIECIVIGIGVNVAKGAVPTTDILRFPAISLEHVLGQPPEREPLLHDILANIIALRPHLATDSFIASWEKKLAYNGRQVQVEMGGEQSVTGKVVGLEPDGSLRLRDEHGKYVTVRFGDVRLRPFA